MFISLSNAIINYKYFNIYNINKIINNCIVLHSGDEIGT
jgi:hypothetical protein